jgi:magnesium-transporting ATPase (P-type)
MSDSSINQGNQVQAGFLNDNALFYLKSVSPWLRFLGVIYYIICGFLVAGGLIMLIAAPLMEDLDFGGETSFLMGVFYLISAIITFFPARFIYFFGARLRNYFLNNAEKELELAFKYNKSFWKFCGIITIICLALIPIAISLAVYASMAGYF